MGSEAGTVSGGKWVVFGEEAVEVNGGATRIPWQPINTLPEEERVLLYFPKTEGGPQVISGVRVHRHILTGIDYSGEDWGGGGEPTYWQRFNPPAGESRW